MKFYVLCCCVVIMYSNNNSYGFVLFSDGLQQSDSASELERDMNCIDIVETVRQLITDLIDNVVGPSHNDNLSTSKPLKRRATDNLTSSSEPKRRRPFYAVSRRAGFNPVSEHHLWCPYVCDVTCDAADDASRKPWMRLLRRLVPDPEAALARVQTSPAPEGIERIRKLFRSWTSSKFC